MSILHFKVVQIGFVKEVFDSLTFSNVPPQKVKGTKCRCLT